MIKNYCNYALSLFNLVKYRLKKTRVPLFTALAITNKCNYQCTYCYGDYSHQTNENLSVDELISTIDTLKEMGTRIINLIGGEPLLRDEIDLLINRVKKKGMICHVSTNASLLPEKIAKIKNVDAIDVGLDGLEENNDKNRGKGTFQRTFEGIKTALKNNIKTNVNMVLTKHNLDDVEPMVRLAAEMGFSLSFNMVFESHSRTYKNYRDSIRIKNADDLLMKNTLNKIIIYIKKGYPIRFSSTAYTYALNWPISYSECVYVKNKDALHNFKPIKCYFPQFHCYIDTEGRIYNCMHIKDHVPIINIKEMGVKKAWEKLSSVKQPCIACYTICNNDANLIFGLKPATLITTFFDLINLKSVLNPYRKIVENK